MLIIHHSNRLDLLQKLVSSLIKQNPLPSVFQKEKILVQSSGMAQWLKLTIAQEQGIAANIDFPLPATFIWQLFTKFLDNVPKQNAFSKENLCWRFMALLPHLLTKPEFIKLKQYVEYDKNDLKYYQLAQMLADLYDQYLVYRPDWIQQWESNQLVPLSQQADQKWQQQLWFELIQSMQQEDQNSDHRARLAQKLIDYLNNNAFKSKIESLIADSKNELPSRLFIFGISSMAPQYLEILNALSQHIDIHFIYHNPTPFYWGDIQSETFQAKKRALQRKQGWIKGGSVWQQQFKNPFIVDDAIDKQNRGNALLASMGRIGRDLLQQLTHLNGHEIEAFVQIESDSLLHQIQQDILYLTDINQSSDADHKEKPIFNATDRSITIHKCHSPMREIEVLHDQLLSFFEEDARLTPKEIVVMVSDIEQYAPFIQAVFSNAPTERFIPFSISDRNVQEELPLIQAFFQLLNLPNLRCTQTEILSLLEVNAIAHRFSIDESQFNKISSWLKSTNVRWGLDHETATEFGLPEQYQNSWLFGLQRMLLGYAVPYTAGAMTIGFKAREGVHSTSFKKIIGFDAIQGLEAELVGVLADYIEKLIYYRASLQASLTMAEWVILLNQLLDDFFVSESSAHEKSDEEQTVVLQIKETLAQFLTLLTENRYEETPLPLSIVVTHLEQSLTQYQMNQRFLAGHVNFCTLMPMRSIPFKIVCLLGMSDEQYPRNSITSPLDLLSHDHRLGDRNHRDEDRYLFLEALLSAQERFYISYIGHSILDNAELPASVLVNEVIRYCDQNYLFINQQKAFISFEDCWLITHTLAAFNPNAFIKTENNQESFAIEWFSKKIKKSEACNESDNLRKNDQESLIMFQNRFEISEPTTINELSRFWKFPSRYLFNKQYHIYFERPSQSAEDSEPFELNPLQEYQLRSDWLRSALQEQLDLDNETEFNHYFRDQWLASGQLPIGSISDQLLNKIISPIKSLYSKLHSYQRPSQSITHIHLDLSIDFQWDHKALTKEIHLRDRLDNIYLNSDDLSETDPYCFIYYDCGVLNGDRLLSFWIKHLCCCATLTSENARSSLLLTLDKKEEGSECITTTLRPVDPSSARLYLKSLLELYYLGMQQPIPYFPKAIWSTVQEIRKNDQGEIVTDSEIKQLLEKSFLEDKYSFKADRRFKLESCDPYIKKVWPNWSDPLAQELLILLKRIWIPLFKFMDGHFPISEGMVSESTVTETMFSEPMRDQEKRDKSGVDK